MTQFDAPPKATLHCRHYSYDRDGGGPACARGVNLQARNDTRPCMPPAKGLGLSQPSPGPLGHCTWRAEYTEAERSRWNAHVEAKIMRLATAIDSLPHPIPVNTSGKQPCPNCDGGTLNWQRWNGGAAMKCTTPHCTEASHIAVRSGTDWPQATTNKEAEND